MILFVLPFTDSDYPFAVIKLSTWICLDSLALQPAADDHS